MPQVTLETTGVKTLADGATTASGTLEDGLYRLPSGGWLVAVSLGSYGGVQASAFAVIDVQMGKNVLIRLERGWVRGTASPMQEGLTWEGRLPLNTGPSAQNFVRFLIDNDTGANWDWQGAWTVEHE